jgi:hypothetical protein
MSALPQFVALRTLYFAYHFLPAAASKCVVLRQFRSGCVPVVHHSLHQKYLSKQLVIGR